MGCGVGLGGGVLSLAQAAIGILKGDYALSAPSLLDYGLFAAIGVGAFFGVRRSLPLGNLWQTGMIAVLSAFGALLVGFAGALAHSLLGVPGLLLWTAAAFTVGVVGSRWAEGGVSGTREAGNEGVV